MTTLTATIQIANPDAEDRDVMAAKINAKNLKIVADNSTVPPPAVPKPLLLMSTTAERKASIEAILTADYPSVWASHVEQYRKELIAKGESNVPLKDFRTKYLAATPTKQAESIAAAMTVLG